MYTKRQWRRIEYAFSLAEKLRSKIERNRGCIVWYDGEVLGHCRVICTRTQIMVQSDEMSILVFEVTEEYDHGLDWTLSQIKAKFDAFEIYKRLK